MKGSLKSLLGNKSSLSVSNKVRIYKTCLRPILTYAAPVWYNMIDKDRIRDRVQALETSVFREILHVPLYIPNKDIEQDLNFIMIEEYIRTLSKTYFHKAINHENPLIARANAYIDNIPMKYSRPRGIKCSTLA